MTICQNVGIGTENPQGELHVTKPAPKVEITFTGSGLNDLIVNQSGFTGDAQISYYIRVENVGPDPNLFRWSNDGINYSLDMPMSSSAISLNNGLTISFSNTNGHSYGDEWTFSISPPYPDGLVVKNGNVGVGTSSPISRLDVEGAINIGNKLVSAQAGDLRFDDRSGDFEGFDGDKWYSLTGKMDAYISADTSGANSYNMTTDFNNPIYVADSSGYIYDDGGPIGNCSQGSMDIYLVNNAPQKAVALLIQINNENYGLDLYVGDEYIYTSSNDTRTITHFVSQDTIRLSKFRPTSSLYSGFKIIYQFLFSETDSHELPEGNFPLYFVKSKSASLGGSFQFQPMHLDSIGEYSFQYGYNTQAKGARSVALGSFTKAIGYSSVAIGDHAFAQGNYSIALGSASATGSDAFAAGTYSFAGGNYSTALGYYSKAYGPFSVSIGSLTQANNAYSFAMGQGTETNADNSFAIGKYNIGETNSIFEVGYGSSFTNLNALTIKNNGYIGTKDVNQPLANLHLKYANDGWNSHLRMDYGSSDYGVIVYDFDGFKLRTFGSGDKIIFRNSANLTNAEFYENGNAWIRGSLTQNSDLRLKKNISPLKTSLASLMNLNGYRYYWKDVNRDSQIQTGVLAQEVEVVFPELVANDQEDFLSVNYIGLIPHLIEAVKELKLEIDTLRADNKDLKGELQEIGKEMETLKVQSRNSERY